MVPKYTQQLLLISNCGKTGIKCKNPPIFAISIKIDAIVLSLTKIAGWVWSYCYGFVLIIIMFTCYYILLCKTIKY